MAIVGSYRILMRRSLFPGVLGALPSLSAPQRGRGADTPPAPRPADPGQGRERTCSPTHPAWHPVLQGLSGRFDGFNHVDEVQPARDGEAIAQGGDVDDLSPGEGCGKFPCRGVKERG